MQPDWCLPDRVRGYYETTQEVTVEVTSNLTSLNWPITVPEGTAFESSVPRFLWWFWSPHDASFLKAALVHDWLLEFGVSPEVSDSVWFLVATNEGAPRWKAELGRTGMRFRRFFQWATGRPYLVTSPERASVLPAS